jgi:hypothetical protein
LIYRNAEMVLVAIDTRPLTNAGSPSSSLICVKIQKGTLNKRRSSFRTGGSAKNAPGSCHLENLFEQYPGFILQS